MIDSPEKPSVRVETTSDSLQASVDSHIAQRLSRGPPACILWARLDSIGDNVLAASMLPHVRQRFPHARLTAFCQDHIVQLYEACPYVDEIVGIDLQRARKDKKYARSFEQRWQSVRPDLVLNSVFSRDAFTDRLIAATGAPMRIAMEGDLSNTSEKEHLENRNLYHQFVESDSVPAPEFQRHADFLKALGIDAPSLQPLVWTTSEDEAFAEEFFHRHGLLCRGPIGLFLGAQWSYKLYGRFAEAIRPFAGHPLLLFGSAKEMTQTDQFCQTHSGIAHNLTGKTTLRQMAALLRRCRLLLGTDSAGAHIAAAVGTPQVVIVGGGHFGRFFPYAPSTTVVCLPLDCYRCNWRCQFTRAHCIQDIAPEVIARAVTKTLEGPGVKPRLFVQNHVKPGFSPGRPQGADLARFIDLSAVETLHETLPPPPSNWPLISVISVVAAAEADRVALLLAENVREQQHDYPWCEHLLATFGGPVQPIGTSGSGSKLSLVSLPQRNWPQAINHLLEMARGEIVTWLGPGETYEKGSLRVVAAIFNEHPQTNAIIGAASLNRRPPSRLIETSSQIFCRRRLLDQLGPLDESLPQTAWLDFCLRISANDSVCSVPNTWIRYNGRDEPDPARETLTTLRSERWQLYRRHWRVILRSRWRRLFGRYHSSEPNPVVHPSRE